MPPRICCCGYTSCVIGSDAFNRDDSDNPGPLWKELSGDWDIVDNQLVCVTPGTLATRICHPIDSPRGSFVAEFELANIADGKVYRARAGDPNGSTYEATWTVHLIDTGTYEVEVTLTDGTTTESSTANIRFLEGYIPVGHFCYAPGVDIVARVTILGLVEDDPRYDVGICIGSGGSRCFGDVGNFSFLEGDFDNWRYEIHWIDRRSCPFCECMCIEKSYGEVERVIRCWPNRLTLSLVRPAECPGIPASFTLNRIIEFGGTDYDKPEFYDMHIQSVWISALVVRENFYYFWRLDCEGAIHPNYSTVYPRMRLQLCICTDFGVESPLTSDPNCVQDCLGFDKFYPETLSYIVLGGPNMSRTRALSLASSTCDPIVLRFPPIKEFRLIFSHQAFLCSYSGYHDNTVGMDGEIFSYGFEVEVTE